MNLNASNSSDLNAFENNEFENNEFENNEFKDNTPKNNASDFNKRKKTFFNYKEKIVFKREEKIVFNREDKNLHFINCIKIMQNDNALNKLYWLYDSLNENLKSKYLYFVKFAAIKKAKKNDTKMLYLITRIF